MVGSMKRSAVWKPGSSIMATEPSFELWGPALFTARTLSAERPWVLHAIGGDGSMTGWRMSSPALSIKFGHSWCNLRITDAGGLEVDTSGNQTWLAIDASERLAMITAIRTRSRVYTFTKAFRHVSQFATEVPYSSDLIVGIGGETADETRAKRARLLGE